MSDRFFGPKLFIDMDAVARNYEVIKRLSGAAKVAAVLKANAYGLGILPVVDRIAMRGCGEIFVFSSTEGANVRANHPDIRINVLSGINPGEEDLFLDNALSPVINTLRQHDLWSSLSGKKAMAVLNIETNPMQLGIAEKDWSAFTPEVLAAGNIDMIMLHFFCAEYGLDSELVQKMNESNLRAFANVRNHFNLPISVGFDAFWISRGKLDADHIRTGAALHGIQVFHDMERLSPVMRVETDIIDVKSVGERKIAVCYIGYSSGFSRGLAGKGKLFFKHDNVSHPVKILSVGMNMMRADVTDIPDEALEGSVVELLNSDYTINDMFADSGVLDTEIMTHLDIPYVKISRLV